MAFDGGPATTQSNVRFCRATLGTLATGNSSEPNARMIMRIFDSDNLARRIKRSMREIVVAVVLTLAALAFVVAALSRSTPETAAVTESDKPESKPN